MGRGKYSSSLKKLRKMAGGNGNDNSEKLLNAPWQHYEGNKVSVGATIASAESRIKGNPFETGILADRDGFVVAAYKGGKSSVSFGNEPAERFEGGTITHNHPGGSNFFSVADIATPAVYEAMGGKLREMRATTKNNGTVSLVAYRQDSSWNKLATAYNKAHDGIIKDWIDNGDLTRVDSAGEFFHRWFEKNAPKYGFRFTFTRG